MVIVFSRYGWFLVHFFVNISSTALAVLALIVLRALAELLQ